MFRLREQQSPNLLTAELPPSPPTFLDVGFDNLGQRQYVSLEEAGVKVESTATNVQHQAHR
jgi:hypothetical protein